MAEGKESAGTRISRWFREMRSELKKVVWPTRQQLINNTIIVLVVIFAVGIVVWLFDLGLHAGLNLILGNQLQ